MLRTGRLALIVLAAYALVFGYRWWLTSPRYPVTRDAEELVLRSGDLPASFRQLPDARSIPENPYEDYTEHYLGGYHVEFAGAAGGEWSGVRVVSSTFLLSRQGAEKVYRMYGSQLRGRGETQPLPPLGEASLFILSRGETAAPVVIVGVVRVENVLFTLTVLSERELDPALVHGWARVLVGRVP